MAPLLMIEITEAEWFKEPGCGHSAMSRLITRKLGKEAIAVEWTWHAGGNRTVFYRLLAKSEHKARTHEQLSKLKP